jgi:hypothetical protein
MPWKRSVLSGGEVLAMALRSLIDHRTSFRRHAKPWSATHGPCTTSPQLTDGRRQETPRSSDTVNATIDEASDELNDDAVRCDDAAEGNRWW